MSKPTIRCAIYTRKSTVEGLDQDFNSLNAQREACAAYIASQRHEGWKMLPARYDNGGVSGGTLDRAALHNLLAEIDAERVDMVVVYKIDRLTRSLADFAKLVDRLDAAACSFVSVTQAFNTSSSMGRLTLNVLLSFAQFEREVTAERIRDKISASKKKGMWMGGLSPLGYDPHPDATRRELVINDDEAHVVKTLFNFYARFGRLRDVAQKADELGLRSKRRIFSTGRVQGGTKMSVGHIHKILTNPVYRGMIRHKDATYTGIHPAIIDEDLWNRVRDKLQAASVKRRGPQPGEPVGKDGPLKGKLRDETGDLLTPTHSQKDGKRHHYYASNRLISNGPDPSAWRLPASALEAAVVEAIVDHLSNCADRHVILAQPEANASASAAANLQAYLRKMKSGGIAMAAELVAAGVVSQSQLSLTLDSEVLRQAADLPPGDLAPDLTQIHQPFRCRRRGVEVKIIAGQHVPAPDPTLIDALRKAHRWANQIKTGTSLKLLSKSEGVSERYMARIIHLSGLSPKLQDAIIAGTQPVEMTLKSLLSRPLPLDWTAQEHRFNTLQ
ncbi:recombinase family protein [Shimia sp. R9_3]|uniref:recombinase family protein n=1 Tax=Shimia sp. R9_3 TaxID=2821113 RepID=UPI001ADBA119|nr:recombinase family protein [Shimia sp. R9_3]MBO9400926.1 recombinase family protein [Shimia sp. R9_3]